MTKAEKQNLIASIEYLAERVSEERGNEAVDYVFQMRGVRNLFALNEGDLWNLYGDLHQMDTD